ncbi:MAG: UDP-N-acetylglucosamine 1-carboxyvinyltransferase, partial [Saprospiraceae bacterium]
MYTDSFQVQGGRKLKGTLQPQGAKNEALQILCAVLLTKEKVTISNIPGILDVTRLIELLAGLGVEVTKISEDTYEFVARDIDTEYLSSEEFDKKAKAIRGSVMLIGPLLARLGKMYLPKPGGDKIGRRRLDTHFSGLQHLGATVHYDASKAQYYVEAEKLIGKYLLMDEISVTGTANVIMAAVFAQGTTTIYNAACEPYTQQLCKMLARMGAKISGIGSNMLMIEGVTSLSGTAHRMLPDMIEVGSFIGLAAMTQSEITISNAGIKDLGVIPDVFRKMGVTIEEKGDDLFIPAQDEYEISTFMDGSILTVYDAPWPGFT